MWVTSSLLADRAPGTPPRRRPDPVPRLSVASISGLSSSSSSSAWTFAFFFPPLTVGMHGDIIFVCGWLSPFVFNHKDTANPFCLFVSSYILLYFACMIMYDMYDTYVWYGWYVPGIWNVSVLFSIFSLVFRWQGLFFGSTPGYPVKPWYHPGRTTGLNWGCATETRGTPPTTCELEPHHRRGSLSYHQVFGIRGWSRSMKSLLFVRCFKGKYQCQLGAIWFDEGIFTQLQTR